eukprot:TRINITY_DN5794_c0_g1_i1.p1 TRINITY_DN5794_c0_g1~~TRINITY_DN5794_c0_g1_i1.p1  ORF type:complete len:535 (-),score=134.04 TRINITY_DN5794_c0_g1_i1:235-1839(-)
MFSQFFILNLRGDPVLFRDYRGDISPQINTTELFFVEITTKELVQPVFQLTEHHLHFIWTFQDSLYFVLVWNSNIEVSKVGENEEFDAKKLKVKVPSPFFAFELLDRIRQLFRDFLGMLNEESLRRNFSLTLELLDEIIDFGYIQTTSTRELKRLIHDKPVPPEDSSWKIGSSGILSTLSNWNGTATTPSNASQKPVVATSSWKDSFKSMVGEYASGWSSVIPSKITSTLQSSQKSDEIFVDIIEKLFVTFKSNGELFHSSISGKILVKNLLEDQKPALCVALSPVPVVSHRVLGPVPKESFNSESSTLKLDDCIFHECVKMKKGKEAVGPKDEFVFDFFPPSGEFTLMNYRLSLDRSSPKNRISLPLKIENQIETMSETRFDIVVQIECSLPAEKHLHQLCVDVPLPSESGLVSVSCELSNREKSANGGGMGSQVEHLVSENKVVWRTKKFPGSYQQQLRIKCFVNAGDLIMAKKRTIGSVSVDFEVPMWTSTGLSIKWLKTQLNAQRGTSEGEPTRWIRYVTQSDSFQSRLT